MSHHVAHDHGRSLAPADTANLDMTLSLATGREMKAHTISVEGPVFFMYFSSCIERPGNDAFSTPKDR